MDEKQLQKIQEQLGYKFRQPALLKQAFTRRSYATENGGEDNEVMEFLGDKALGFIVAKKMAEFYGARKRGVFLSDRKEGELSLIQKALVSRPKLAYKINLLDFHKYLIMGKGDIANNVQDEDSVKEDLFEAILGAVAIDSRWSVRALESVIQNLLDIDYALEDGNEDYNYVDRVQRWAQKEYGVIPEYVVVEPEYYDAFGVKIETNHPRFECRLKLPNIGEVFIGEGDTKSEARQFSALEAYTFLEKNNLLPSMVDELKNPCRELAINQLQQLAQKGFIYMPEYWFEERHDGNGNPIWYCECNLHNYGAFFSEDSKKTEAKKSAAFKMLSYVLFGTNEDVVREREYYRPKFVSDD